MGKAAGPVGNRTRAAETVQRGGAKLNKDGSKKKRGKIIKKTRNRLIQINTDRIGL